MVIQINIYFLRCIQLRNKFITTISHNVRFIFILKCKHCTYHCYQSKRIFATSVLVFTRRTDLSSFQRSHWSPIHILLLPNLAFDSLFRCIRLDCPAARCSGRPKLPRQFVPVRNFELRLFVPMPGNMGRPAFTFINLYIFCNLQRIINNNIHLGYVCTCVYIF